MKTKLTVLLVLAMAILAPAADAEDTKPADGASKQTDPQPIGEREGLAMVLHREEVLHDRGGSKHLWPLLHTAEARVNYFEVTSRGALHFHPDADHRLYVLEGTVLVTCGAVTTKCTPGDFIIIPRGVRHCYDVPAPGEKALLLTLDAPPYDPQKTVNVEPKPVAK